MDVSECYAEVPAALLALPHDLREAMTLFVYEGMGYADIAKLTGCSAKAKAGKESHLVITPPLQG